MSSSSNRAAKRSAPDEEESSTHPKKSLVECMFGAQCFRKNPAHFLVYSHQHLNDILPKWTGGDGLDSLPSTTHPHLKSNFKTTVEQLKILKAQGQSCKSSREIEAVEAKGSGFSNKNQNAAIASNSKANSEEKNAKSETKLAQMIQEKTKHHGDVQAKLDAAAPYYFFLTSIEDSPQTHLEPLSITFTELLDQSLGELESSLQINFMVEMGWLLAQYIFTGNRFKPLTLLYGVDDGINEHCKFSKWNITAVHVKPPNAFGHHHTKMSIMSYTDSSIRVIVSTANLVESDWQNRTQGLWVSPRLPQLPLDVDTTAGDSPTLFKSDLLRYLNFYRLPQLQEWINKVRRADFSSVRVCLVASVPGTHYGPDLHLWGHRRLCTLLKSHVSNPNATQYPWNTWPIIGQFSSIGTLGPNENSWVCSELRSSMSAPSTPLQIPPIKLIYPSLNNVRQSYDGLLGGACLPYQRKVHVKQLWLEKYLHCWKSEVRFRSRAMPHIKSYARVSPGNDVLSWFLLTSANLSKAAWGSETKNSLPGRGLRILSYEAGVLFLPHFIVNDDLFNLEQNTSSKTANICKNIGSKKRHDYPPFPLHVDLPLQAYGASDSPWLYDIFSDK